MASTTRSASALLVTVPVGIPVREVSAAALAASRASCRNVSRTRGWAEMVASGCQEASPPSRPYRAPPSLGPPGQAATRTPRERPPPAPPRPGLAG